jgi:FG-GAP-like repeat
MIPQSVLIALASDGEAARGCRCRALGNGDWTFGSPVQYPVTDMELVPLAVGDVNGDGKLDLILGASGQTGYGAVLLGPGNGTFGAPICSADYTGPWFLAVADLNGDGKLDAASVILNQSQGFEVAVQLGNGDGIFQVPVEYSTASFPVLNGGLVPNSGDRFGPERGRQTGPDRDQSGSG